MQDTFPLQFPSRVPQVLCHLQQACPPRMMGGALVAKLPKDPVSLDADEGTEPLLRIGRHLHRATCCSISSPGTVGSSSASTSSCTSTPCATAIIVSCIGCTRRHYAGGSDPSCSTLRSTVSMSRLKRTRQSSRVVDLRTTSSGGCPRKRETCGGHASGVRGPHVADERSWDANDGSQRKVNKRHESNATQTLGCLKSTNNATEIHTPRVHHQTQTRKPRVRHHRDASTDRRVHTTRHAVPHPGMTALERRVKTRTTAVKRLHHAT